MLFIPKQNKNVTNFNKWPWLGFCCHYWTFQQDFFVWIPMYTLAYSAGVAPLQGLSFILPSILFFIFFILYLAKSCIQDPESQDVVLTEQPVVNCFFNLVQMFPNFFAPLTPLEWTIVKIHVDHFGNGGSSCLPKNTEGRYSLYCFYKLNDLIYFFHAALPFSMLFILFFLCIISLWSFIINLVKRNIKCGTSNFFKGSDLCILTCEWTVCCNIFLSLKKVHTFLILNTSVSDLLKIMKQYKWFCAQLSHNHRLPRCELIALVLPFTPHGTPVTPGKLHSSCHDSVCTVVHNCPL